MRRNNLSGQPEGRIKDGDHRGKTEEALTRSVRPGLVQIHIRVVSRPSLPTCTPTGPQVEKPEH